jgi:hypothetical protein
MGLVESESAMKIQPQFRGNNNSLFLITFCGLTKNNYSSDLLQDNFSPWLMITMKQKLKYIYKKVPLFDQQLLPTCRFQKANALGDKQTLHQDKRNESGIIIYTSWPVME